MPEKDKNVTFEEKAASIITVVMVLMVVAQILSRYLFHKSISYTEEIVRYLFVWATLIGSSAALYGKAHLSISLSIGDSVRGFSMFKRIMLFCGAFLFFSVIIIYGSKVVYVQFTTGQTTASMGYPMWVIGLAIPLCGILLIYRMILLCISKGDRNG